MPERRLARTRATLPEGYVYQPPQSQPLRVRRPVPRPAHWDAEYPKRQIVWGEPRYVICRPNFAISIQDERPPDASQE